MVAPEILGACGCVYVKFFFYKFGGLKIFLKAYLYVIFLKKFGGL